MMKKSPFGILVSRVKLEAVECPAAAGNPNHQQPNNNNRPTTGSPYQILFFKRIKKRSKFSGEEEGEEKEEDMQISTGSYPPEEADYFRHSASGGTE